MRTYLPYLILLSTLFARVTSDCSYTTVQFPNGGGPSGTIQYFSTATDITFSFSTTNQGWLAIGRSSYGMMVGSDAVIGVPGTGVTKYLLDNKYLGSGGVYPSSQSNILSSSVTQTPAGTVLVFTQSLMDERFSLTPNSTATFLWSMGFDNQLWYHCCRGSFVLQLTPCIISTRNPSKKPTKKTSKKPSNKPSKKTTKKPSKKPTKKPSKKPSKKTTKKPTKKPSKKPSKKVTRKV